MISLCCDPSDCCLRCNPPPFCCIPSENAHSLQCPPLPCTIFGSHDWNEKTIPPRCTRKSIYKKIFTYSLGDPVGAIMAHKKLQDLTQALRFATYLCAYAKLFLITETEFTDNVLGNLPMAAAKLIASKPKTVDFFEQSDIYSEMELKVPRDIDMDNCVFKVELGEKFVATIPGEHNYDNEPYTEYPVSLLEQGLQQFFQRCVHCLVTVKNMYFMVWKARQMFFVLDFNGRDSRKFTIDKENGVPMLVCLMGLDNVYHFIKNLCNFNTETFNMREITMSQYISVDGIVFYGQIPLRSNEYEIISTDYAVLRANLHLYRYSRNADPLRSRGALPVGLAFLIASKIDPPAGWDRNMNDKVICYGVNICQCCWPGCADNETSRNVESILDGYPSSLNFGKFKVRIHLYKSKITGTWKCVPNYTKSELSVSIESCFALGLNNLLVEMNDQYYAVLYKSGFYYIFDPYRHRIDGLVTATAENTTDKTASLRMFRTLDAMLKVFNKILLYKNRTSTFYIHTLTILNISMEDEQPQQQLCRTDANDDEVDVQSLNEHICFQENERKCQNLLEEYSESEEEEEFDIRYEISSTEEEIVGEEEGEEGEEGANEMNESESSSISETTTTTVKVKVMKTRRELNNLKFGAGQNGKDDENKDVGNDDSKGKGKGNEKYINGDGGDGDKASNMGSHLNNRDGTGGRGGKGGKAAADGNTTDASDRTDGKTGHGKGKGVTVGNLNDGTSGKGFKGKQISAKGAANLNREDGEGGKVSQGGKGGAEGNTNDGTGEKGGKGGDVWNTNDGTGEKGGKGGAGNTNDGTGEKGGKGGKGGAKGNTNDVTGEKGGKGGAVGNTNDVTGEKGGKGGAIGNTNDVTGEKGGKGGKGGAEGDGTGEKDGKGGSVGNTNDGTGKKGGKGGAVGNANNGTGEKGGKGRKGGAEGNTNDGTAEKGGKGVKTDADGNTTDETSGKGSKGKKLSAKGAAYSNRQDVTGGKGDIGGKVATDGKTNVTTGGIGSNVEQSGTYGNTNDVNANKGVKAGAEGNTNVTTDGNIKDGKGNKGGKSTGGNTKDGKGGKGGKGADGDTVYRTDGKGTIGKETGPKGGDDMVTDTETGVMVGKSQLKGEQSDADWNKKDITDGQGGIRKYGAATDRTVIHGDIGKVKFVGDGNTEDGPGGNSGKTGKRADGYTNEKGSKGGGGGDGYTNNETGEKGQGGLLNKSSREFGDDFDSVYESVTRDKSEKGNRGDGVEAVKSDTKYCIDLLKSRLDPEKILCKRNSKPGYYSEPQNLAVVGSQCGSYYSISKLLLAGFRCADRILTMTPWGNYVIFRRYDYVQRIYYLHDGCTCNVERFRYMDLNCGTVGFMCFHSLHDAISYMIDSKDIRKILAKSRKKAVDNILKEYFW